MARLPVGSLVRIERTINPYYIQDYGGEIGKIVFIYSDRLVRGIPHPYYRLRMKDGKEIRWIDENDLTFIGFLTQ